MIISTANKTLLPPLPQLSSSGSRSTQTTQRHLERAVRSASRGARHCDIRAVIVGRVSVPVPLQDGMPPRSAGTVTVKSSCELQALRAQNICVPQRACVSAILTSHGPVVRRPDCTSPRRLPDGPARRRSACVIGLSAARPRVVPFVPSGNVRAVPRRRRGQYTMP